MENEDMETQEGEGVCSESYEPLDVNIRIANLVGSTSAVVAHIYEQLDMLEQRVIELELKVENKR